MKIVKKQQHEWAAGFKKLGSNHNQGARARELKAQEVTPLEQVLTFKSKTAHTYYSAFSAALSGRSKYLLGPAR